MHLQVEGELSADPHLPPYSWTAPDGVTFSMRGTAVQIDWPNAPDQPDESFGRMTGEVERLLFVESLDTVAPISVRWAAHRQLGVLGGATVFAPAISQSWTSRRDRQPLDRNAGKATVVAQCPELLAALENFRLAMEVWRGDAVESIGRLYLAAEGLVLSLRGDTGRSHWAGLGVAIGMGAPTALRVFFSLQFGRHVNVSQAIAELAKMRMSPLNPNECLNEVGRLIDHYITYRTTHRC